MNKLIAVAALALAACASPEMIENTMLVEIEVGCAEHEHLAVVAPEPLRAGAQAPIATIEPAVHYAAAPREYPYGDDAFGRARCFDLEALDLQLEGSLMPVDEFALGLAVSGFRPCFEGESPDLAIRYDADGFHGARLATATSNGAGDDRITLHGGQVAKIFVNLSERKQRSLTLAIAAHEAWHHRSFVELGHMQHNDDNLVMSTKLSYAVFSLTLDQAVAAIAELGLPVWSVRYR
jgi:hypothetical protein